jgi:two-component system, OmpR family, response regulator
MSDSLQYNDAVPDVLAPASSRGPIRVGSNGVEVDLSQRLVTRRQQTVHLTPSEWQVLEALLPQRGKAMPKAELSARVAQSTGTSVNALEVHLSNLRRKLGRDVVETIRGRGYRIRE